MSLYRKLFPKQPVNLRGAEREQWTVQTYGMTEADLNLLSEYNALESRFVFKPAHVARMKKLQQVYNRKMGLV